MVADSREQSTDENKIEYIAGNWKLFNFMLGLLPLGWTPATE